MFGLFIGGLIGYMFGRFPGFLIGAAAGVFLTRYIKHRLWQKISHVQTGFLESVFAVMGALCKADGVVTRDEIEVAEKLFTQFHLSGENRERAKAAFNRGKADDFDLDAELQRFLQITAVADALTVPDRFEEFRHLQVEEQILMQFAQTTGSWIRRQEERCNWRNVADPDGRCVFSRCNRAPGSAVHHG